MPEYMNWVLGRQVKLIKSSTSFEGAIFEEYAGLRVEVEMKGYDPFTFCVQGRRSTH